MATKQAVAAPKKTKVAAAVTKILPLAEKYDDIMVDLETLDTAVGGVIVSIGAVKFNEKTMSDEAFYRAVTIESNLAEHRTISPSTLRWWMQQEKAAQAVFNDKAAIPLEQALDELRAWGGDAKTWENIRVWGNGADFDCAMLAHAYGLQGTPWIFWNTRCFRTLKSSAAGKRVPKPANTLAHNALADAVAQAQHLQAMWAAGVCK